VVEAVGPTSMHTRSVTDRVALTVATVGGVGYSPVAPGTAGSLVAVAILWLVPFSRPGLIAYFIVKDPGAIVIDEVAGMALSVLALPLTPAVLAVAFVLFRVFDVVKPPPARGSQSLPGGVGVMVDDLIAGLYTLAVVGVLRGVLRWP